MFITRGSTRQRLLPGPTLSFHDKRWFRDAVASLETALDWVNSCNGTQITESDGNRWPLPKGSDIADSGSEFYSIKTEILPRKFPYAEVKVKWGAPGRTGWTHVINGSIFVANAFERKIGGPQTSAHEPLRPVVADLSSSRSSLNTKGAIAIAACNPGNPIIHAASAVGELLQDVPNIPGVGLWKSRLGALEALGAGAGEFLNLVFGVNPTISDMMSFVKATHKVDRAVDQFIRDSGRTVRRKYYFPKERSETETVLPATSYSPVGQIVPSGNCFYPDVSYAFPGYETIRRRVVERETWFSGAFTYHIPDWYETGNREDRIRLTAKLLGAEPDIQTLWQLTPWSWAVDWVVNAGSFVKNLQSLVSYGTVLRYGYIMETTTVTDTYSAGARVYTPSGPDLVAFNPPYPAVHPVTVRNTVKKRIQANPFGFGISWDGLSTVQQAIVAALGITRVVR
ncbi:TPA_asm: maturation protein [ssRNA phage Zoerhiza.2_23]|uniref:Maturation protein n=2 Tax=Leviviricetes TaxID=2842243 RepID=A0A8S5L213_9VIRU|nr:maturation protein [ssRNA phage Zoerhiza.2_23]QDH90472.1 MAG: hypothetical protein H2Rhizo33597_000003 [Leviviridae sp.]DAD51523.1 TPA_asm: maturation protein [ssRNA phage Zoerhiza.2_23]